VGDPRPGGGSTSNPPAKLRSPFESRRDRATPKAYLGKASSSRGGIGCQGRLGRWRPPAGENASATLTVRNDGEASAWDVSVAWNIPGVAPGEIEMEAPRTGSRKNSFRANRGNRPLSCTPGPNGAKGARVCLCGSARWGSVGSYRDQSRAVGRSFRPAETGTRDRTWSTATNGVLEPGDRVEVRMLVQNTGASEALGVHPMLTAQAGGFDPKDPYDERKNLAPAELGRFIWNFRIPRIGKRGGRNGRASDPSAIKESRGRYDVAPWRWICVSARPRSPDDR